MSVLGKQLYFLTKEDIKCVRSHFGKNEKDIEKDCNIIREWMKQQSHLPDDYDAERIERFLLKNKFRLERTKVKIENYYTVRGVNINFLRNMDLKGIKMQKILKTISLAPLPKLYNNLERIYFLRFTGNDADYTWEYNSLVSLAALEMELKYEYAAGMRFIVDLEGFSLTHLKSIDVNILSTTFYMFQECLSARIVSVEYINTPSMMNIILDILKLALPQKLYNKIRIHQNLASLRNIIPVEYLPKDYGGKLKSTDEYYGDFEKFLLENMDYLMDRVEVVSDESKRIGDTRKNDLFGVDGTFKHINLD